MKLVSMKLSKEQSKGNAIDAPSKFGTDGSAPQYSYNTQFSLGNHELDKIGMKDLPKVGDRVHIRARGHVTAVKHEARRGDKPERRVEIQMTHMGIDGKGDPEDALDAVTSGIEEAPK